MLNANALAKLAVLLLLSTAGCTPYSSEYTEAKNRLDAGHERMRASSYDSDAEWRRKASEGKRPRDYQEAVKRNLRDSAIDPDSLRVDFTSTPQPGLSCGTVNGKNTFGGYTGKHPFAAYFNDTGTLVKVIEVSPDDLRLYRDRSLGMTADASLLRVCGAVS